LGHVNFETLVNKEHIMAKYLSNFDKQSGPSEAGVYFTSVGLRKQAENSELEPGDTVNVDLGECGKVKNATVHAIIITEHGSFAHVLVDPADKEGWVALMPDLDWISKT
jgi:hypothetical protein